MEKEFMNVSIPTSLYKKIEEKIKDSEIKSVSSYITKVLRESLSEEKASQEPLSKEDEEKVKERLKALGYILNLPIINNKESKMISPHGGKLVNRILRREEKEKILGKAKELPSLKLKRESISEVENIAFGVFSPLEGFLRKKDYQNVLNQMRLSDDLPWPIPIVLDSQSRFFIWKKNMNTTKRNWQRRSSRRGTLLIPE